MNTPHNPYAPPQAKVEDAPAQGEVSAEPAFYAVAMQKFYLLYFFTMGAYAAYWSYRNWRAQKEFAGADVMPIMRGIFMVFFVHGLLERVEARLKGAGGRFEGDASMLATLLVVTIIASSISDRVAGMDSTPAWVAVASFGFLPLLAYLFGKVQRNINAACGDPEGRSNATLTGANWFWMALGGLWWLVALAALTVIVFAP